MASNHLQTIIYNGHDTYLANDLKHFFPNLFKGLRSVKDIINKYSIPDDQYFVVKIIKDSSYEEGILIKTEFIAELNLNLTDDEDMISRLDKEVEKLVHDMQFCWVSHT